MVVFHMLRAARYFVRGRLSPAKGVFDEATATVYAGYRMIDGFMHVNNARYLELFEFARWHEGGSKRMYSKFRKAGMYPVVATAHVQFLKEIPPATFVTIKTRLISMEGRSLLVRQHMFDRAGKKLHATALFRLSIVDSRKQRKQQQSTATTATSSATGDGGSSAGEPPQAQTRKPPSAGGGGTLTADEAVTRLGFDPKVVRAQIREAWLKEMVDPMPSAADGAADDGTEASTSLEEAAVKVLDDVNDLDQQWRRVMRQLQQRIRRSGTGTGSK